ncbi:hypothetical protein [Paenibacillus sp. GbtcB18]|uniref:hypothetical protein n=1 Tax=Paenibacillus sp. GbtcB18 TaxID=2824763 RepID=UPI001C2FC05E|nr:hypothetical protein [Paenibacillus sp. GbtcB18]
MKIYKYLQLFLLLLTVFVIVGCQETKKDELTFPSEDMIKTAVINASGIEKEMSQEDIKSLVKICKSGVLTSNKKDKTAIGPAFKISITETSGNALVINFFQDLRFAFNHNLDFIYMPEDSSKVMATELFEKYGVILK